MRHSYDTVTSDLPKVLARFSLSPLFHPCPPPSLPPNSFLLPLSLSTLILHSHAIHSSLCIFLSSFLKCLVSSHPALLSPPSFLFGEDCDTDVQSHPSRRCFSRFFCVPSLRCFSLGQGSVLLFSLQTTLLPPDRGPCSPSQCNSSATRHTGSSKTHFT